MLLALYNRTEGNSRAVEILILCKLSLALYGVTVLSKC